MATIRKRHDKWQVQVRKQGCRPVSKSFSTKREALAWAREVESRLEVDPEVPGSRDSTFKELIERYIQEVSAQKKGHEPEKTVLRALQRHPLARLKVSTLSVAHFSQYRDERLKKVLPITLKREFSTLSHMFNVARLEWNYRTKGNPISKVRLKAKGNERDRRLESGEVEKIILAIRRGRNPYMEHIFRFAIATGMRRSEIVRLTWEDVKAGQGVIVVRDTKNGETRKFPLIEEVERILRAVQAKHGITSGRIFPVSNNAVGRCWRRVQKRSGVSDLRFHDLRHEAVSRFFESELELPEVAMLSGHKDFRMLKRYIHPRLMRVKDKLERANRP